jgi:VWFA-related protein
MRALLAAALLAQAATPRFPAEVELVTIDAVAVDKDGRPVTGLGKDEWIVREDGEIQEIATFEPYAGDEAPVGEEPGSGVPTSAPHPPAARAGAVFALLVDDLGMSARDVTDTRNALTRFLDLSARDDDAILLASTSGNAWWTATLPEGREDLRAVAGRLKDFGSNAAQAFDHMTDYEAFAIRDRGDATTVARVVERWTSTGACIVVQGRPDPSCPTRVRAAAASFDSIRKQRTQRLLATLRRILDALAGSRGRKSILLYSRGFLEDSDLRIREVTSLAREANAAVYFVDTHGLETHPGSGGAAEPGNPGPSSFGRGAFEAGVLESTGAEALADETGGLSFRNTNDLAAAGMRVARESRAYYLLGLRPRPGRKPGDWRKLEVTVTRPGITVRTRKGYMLRPQAAADTSALVAAALDSAVDAGGIPVRATAFVLGTGAKKATRVLVAAEFDARRLRFEGAAGSRTARLAVSVAVAERDDPRTLTHGEQVEVREPEGGDPGWRSVAREFDLPAGVAQARVVVLDSRGGAIGTASHRFEVPVPAGLRLTTPVVTDRVQGGGADGPPRAAVAVHRVFRPKGAVYCDFEVLGAKADPAVRGPRVAAGLEVRAAGGAVVLRVDPTAIVPDARGRLVRLIGLRVEGWAAGDYELILAVRDEVAGAGVEQRVTFSLRPDELPAP